MFVSAPVFPAHFFMNNIGQNSFDLGYLDTLARGNSFLHRLDPRAKLITTLVFIIAVVSFDKYSLSALMPFFIYPLILIFAGGLPFGYLAKKILWVSPFAILLGIFNPLIDKEIILNIGFVEISGGWVSFFSILLRFILTVSSGLILISLTGFNVVCESLAKLGAPRIFVVQLLLFYRYIFVLVGEAESMIRARSLRANNKSMNFKTFASLIGHLLLRTLNRAERVYLAMCCRGFNGHIPFIRTMQIGYNEIIFLSIWVFLFLFLRFCNVSLLLGKFITGY